MPTPTPTPLSPTPSHDQIARFAARLWSQAGQPSGRDLEFWLQAERQLAAVESEPAIQSRAIEAPDNGPLGQPSIPAAGPRAGRKPAMPTRVIRL